jgi:cyclopropane-fatty-acyl-phospholipid synthase
MGEINAMAAQSSETIIRELLDLADIHVDGKNPWDVQVHDPRFYEVVLWDGQLGLGESYMEGWWDCDSIDEFINRALKAKLDHKIKSSLKIMLHFLSARLINLQAPSRAFEVGEKHYDLGNELYCAMLDKRMNYTCAYWENATTLDQAQEAKLDLVCKKIGVQPGMRILELGCGWGSFAKFAAEKYGADVLGVTVSKEQVALGMELCKGLPVELRLQDYRKVVGQFDAVISIGILEHVGYKNYRTYMEVVERCLKEGGISFVHTIGGNYSNLMGDAWSHKYIFPNGMVPSITQIGAAMENIFVMEDWHNMGPNYDQTLMAWYANFEKAWPQLKNNYDERFYRMWKYYLLSSAGCFRARTLQLWQIVITRLGTTQPDCRIS